MRSKSAADSHFFSGPRVLSLRFTGGVVGRRRRIPPPPPTPSILPCSNLFLGCSQRSISAPITQLLVPLSPYFVRSSAYPVLELELRCYIRAPCWGSAPRWPRKRRGPTSLLRAHDYCAVRHTPSSWPSGSRGPCIRPATSTSRCVPVASSQCSPLPPAP
jgi:hypothetical protein